MKQKSMKKKRKFLFFHFTLFSKQPPSLEQIAMKRQALQYFSHLWEHYSGVSPSSTTIQELSDIWQCTRRNVNLIVKQLQTQKWIRWVPGNGRGRTSQLYFLTSSQQVKHQMALTSIKQGKLETAMAYAHSPEDKQIVLDALASNLGFQNLENDKDILRIPFYRPILNLDPLYTTRRTEAHLVQQIFDNLVYFNPQTQQIQPHLAHSWKVDDHGKRWTFYLRKNIHFHHNRQMVASDVKHTLFRLKQESAPFQQLFQNIHSIECPSNYQVAILLYQGNQMFLDLLTSIYAVIQPIEKWTQLDFARLPSGTGPFKVVKNDEQCLTLEAFPRYFQAMALLDQVEIWMFKDRKTVLLKDADIFLYDPTPDTEQRTRTVALEKGYYFLMCNLNKRGPLQDIHIREALKQRISPQKMIQALGGNRERVAHAILPEWGAFPLDFVEPQPIPVDRPLKLYAYQGRTNEENARWVQNELLSQSIPVELVLLSYQDFCDPEKTKDADLFCYGEVMSDHVRLSLFETFTSHVGRLRECLSSSLLKSIDQELQALAHIPEKEQQFALFQKLNQFTINQRVVFPLYHVKQNLTARKEVQGIHLGNFGWMPFKDLWFPHKK